MTKRKISFYKLLKHTCQENKLLRSVPREALNDMLKAHQPITTVMMALGSFQTCLFQKKRACCFIAGSDHEKGENDLFQYVAPISQQHWLLYNIKLL